MSKTSAGPAPSPPTPNGAPERPPRTAFVLSGGGATGAYEVGVLKALVTGKSPAFAGRAIDPTIFAGTSIGAFAAALLTSHWDNYGPLSVAKLEDAWRESLAPRVGRRGTGSFRIRGNPLDFFNFGDYFPNPLRIPLQLARDGAFLGWELVQRLVHAATASGHTLEERVAELIDFTPFISTDPWLDTLGREIDFQAIRRSQRALRIAVTNWTTGRLKVFQNADMTEHQGPLVIQASSAMPAVFPPTSIGAEPHADGAILMNTPLTLAIQAGADEVFVVYLDPDVRSVPLDHARSTLGAIHRLQQITWAAIVNLDIEKADAVNRGLELLARVDRGEDVGELGADYARKLHLLSWNRGRAYRPLTVHRFHPHEDLTGGATGLLNFERSRIDDLIARGYADGVTHDCGHAGCLFPNPVARSATPVHESRSRQD